MHKIFLIIQREYMTRVKKKSFVVMTILGPLLMAAIVVVPMYVATLSSEKKTVGVLDETGLFRGKFRDSDNIQFHYLDSKASAAKENFKKSGDYALLYIPSTELSLPSNAILYSDKEVSINVKSYIRNVMSKCLEEVKLDAKLRDLPLPPDKKITSDDILKSIKSSVDITTIKIGNKGKEEKSYPEVSSFLGFFSGIMIYFFIFMFGVQVMRGIIEEKSNRIVEVIISSVKPFELMMGKIIGVALVGLTQFLLWVVLTFGIVTIATPMFATKDTSKQITGQVFQNNYPGTQPGKTMDVPAQDNSQVNEVLDAIHSIDFPVMIGTFLFYFLFGYLLYSALFAAVGAAVDSESDNQQFMLPITIPLIFAIIMSPYVMQNPTGPLSFWLSIIPFTSPIIMMIRVPFGVPFFDLFLSMVLLILGFLGTTWLAAKIYRTGILMYGKKVNYKELGKWLRYKN
ncbi:MAG: ABC transporter permease [Bacteroidota bacterium]|nr:ABC transporter permease [Bacteroidota bacterium]